MKNRFQKALDDMSEDMSFQEYFSKHELAIKIALTIVAGQLKLTKEQS